MFYIKNLTLEDMVGMKSGIYYGLCEPPW